MSVEEKMKKLETQREYDKRIRAVIDKATELNANARRYAYREENKRDNLFLQILEKNKHPKNIVNYHEVIEPDFG